LLTEGKPVSAPGVYDALGARLVEEAGFDAVYMTGFGTAASRIGRPDVGLLTMTEMVDSARNIARAVRLPVIADADTGYGNAINVVRTVQEFEQAGVAAIHLEDQVAPKRCGHLEGKQIVPVDEMVSKLRAAVAARTVPDLVLIARTDAAAVEGIDGAIERARRYRDAGADVLFVEAATSEADIERVASELADVPLLFNWVEGGKTPPIPYDRVRELGFAIVIFPVTTLLTAVAFMRQALAQIKADGTPSGLPDGLPSFNAFTEFIGLGEIDELERRFTD
jgi:2-methylisocitrate lyase-like PEP mutase family enzyme